MNNIEILETMINTLERLDNYYVNLTACIIMLVLSSVLGILMLATIIIAQISIEKEAKTPSFIETWSYEDYLREREERKNAYILQHGTVPEVTPFKYGGESNAKEDWDDSKTPKEEEEELEEISIESGDYE